MHAVDVHTPLPELVRLKRFFCGNIHYINCWWYVEISAISIHDVSLQNFKKQTGKHLGGRCLQLLVFPKSTPGISMVESLLKS